MNVQEIILKKRDGEEMSEAEIDFLVEGISTGSIPDYQISAWAMAVYFRGMTERETNQLALAMAYSGEVMDLSAIAGIKVDKHSTGGVGDKTTLVVVPLAAAAGVPIAKMSGRGLGHTGGTIDKFESIPGFKVEMTYPQFVEQVTRINAALIAQTGNLVPADKRLYAIRDVTATIDSIPLIAASVMSKKIAAGAQGIVLDVKVGSGAFMKDRAGALHLAHTMINIGRGAGREVVAILTDMSQPLGEMVGNALEVQEAIDTLQGHGPADLEEITLCLSAHILLLAKKFDSYAAAYAAVQEIMASGAGLEKFCALVAAQGGRLDLKMPGYGLPQAPLAAEVRVQGDGYIASIDAMEVGRTAMLLGAGREKIGDRIDPAVGLQIMKKRGEYVKTGDIIARIYGNDAELMATAEQRLLASYHLEPNRPHPQPLVLETVI